MSKTKDCEYHMQCMWHRLNDVQRQGVESENFPNTISRILYHIKRLENYIENDKQRFNDSLKTYNTFTLYILDECFKWVKEDNTRFDLRIDKLKMS